MPSYTTWTQPVGGTHPRIWLNPATKPAILTRIAGSHGALWSALRAHCDQLLRTTGYPDSYFVDREAEASACLAFSAMLDPTSTDHAARAMQIATHVADQPVGLGAQGRHRMLALALIYDWAYDLLSSNQRTLLRSRIAFLVERFRVIDSSEMVWGSSLANAAYAMTALAAILSDGSTSENATWKGWMDTLFDAFDLGPANQTTFLSSFRHFGSTDGGTHRGVGPNGYDTEAEDLFARLLPALNTAVGVTWEVTEIWWDLLANWKIWHWRGDRSFHRSGEQEAPARYSTAMIPHLLQVASRQTNTLGKNCTWLVNEIEDLRDPPLRAEQLLWKILWLDTARAAERPTVATTGGGLAVKNFPKAGKVVIRDSWEPDGTSVTIEVPQHFVGGHSRRRAGHWNLATQGKPLLHEKGNLDPAQDFTYQDAADATESGHRYTYGQRIAAANVCRIFDTDEPSENAPESFQRLPFADARYGVLSGGTLTISNDGGQLAPKSGAALVSTPSTLQQLLSESKWNFASWLITPVDDVRYAHAVFDLKPFYYTSKCTTYRRHFLWVKPGAIPAWKKYPVLLVYDDVVAHVDAVKGKTTCVLQIQAPTGASGTIPNLQSDRAPARAFVKVLLPVSAEKTDVTDPAIEGVTYPVTGTQAADDPLGIRIEINAPSSSTTQRFLAVIFPAANTVSAAPTVTLIDDATYVGATIGGIDCKVTKAAPYLASVSTSTDLTPPSVPTGLSATARRDCVDVDWSASGASDLDFYRVYRATSAGGPFSAIGTTTALTYRDYAVTNGTTYFYRLTAVDTSGNESGQTANVSATPATGIQGPGLVRPWPVGQGRRSQASIRRRREAWRGP